MCQITRRDLELQMAVSHHVGSGNRILVLYNRNNCF